MRGITKRYGSVSVLSDLDLDVAPGEFLTLLGPSGSGKTTLLMILAGFVRANAGSVKVGGEEIIAMPPHKRNIGMVFQNYALFPHMNVFHNIAFPLKQRRTSAAETRRGWTRRWTWCSSAAWPTGASTSSPAAHGSGSRWRAPSCSSRASC
jgi:putative spermidine/putrescine transport system ATP-binding protein